MQTQVNTPCIICGKTRIFSRRWKGKDNDKGTMVTHVETVCPDSACQKIVDAKFQEMRDKRNLADEKRRNNVHKPRVAAIPVRTI